MKKHYLLAGLLFIVAPAFSCTTFFINKNGQLLFGRNYDWVTGNGMVCSNQRGLAKTSAPRQDGKTVSWVSKYGSITFNQYGKEFPTGGMNEKGLVVELMWLDGTSYPQADYRPAVGVLQWIQYHLDNCSTVEELIAEDKNIRISAVGNSPLHYLVADAKGNAATIEFFNGKMKVHKDASLPVAVLANDRYDESIANTNRILDSSPKYSFTSNSMDRFAKACQLVKKFDAAKSTASMAYAFDVLDQVAQGSHTKWSIVYDIANRKVQFRSLLFRDIKEVSFSSFDFSCNKISKTWNINQAGSGEVSDRFVDFSMETNHRLVNQSFDESSSEFTVSEKGRTETAFYPSRIRCQ